METETIMVNVGKDVMDKLRKLAAKEKQKKGFLGKTITEATISVNELKASEITAMLLYKKPTITFRINKSILPNIPNKVAFLASLLILTAL